MDRDVFYRESLGHREASVSYNLLQDRDFKEEKKLAKSSIASMSQYTNRSQSNFHNLLCNNNKTPLYMQFGSSDPADQELKKYIQ